jgi:hypothetical protein
VPRVPVAVPSCYDGAHGREGGHRDELAHSDGSYGDQAARIDGDRGATLNIIISGSACSTGGVHSQASWSKSGIGLGSKIGRGYSLVNLIGCLGARMMVTISRFINIISDSTRYRLKRTNVRAPRGGGRLISIGCTEEIAADSDMMMGRSPMYPKLQLTPLHTLWFVSCPVEGNHRLFYPNPPLIKVMPVRLRAASRETLKELL